MKNKMLKSIALLTLTVGALASCSPRPQVQVGIPLPTPDALDFSTYKSVFLADFTIDSAATSVPVQDNLKDLFFEEVQTAIGRDILPLPGNVKMTQQDQLPEEFTKKHPESLVITGKFVVDIKTQSIVKDQKGGKRGKVRVLAKIEMWTMTLDTSFIETKTGRKRASYSFSDKLNDADPEKQDYNFKYLLDEISEKLIKRVTRTHAMTKRILLLK